MNKISNFTVHGNGYFDERKILFFWCYKRIIIQQWSPLMHEYTVERGVRVRSYRIAVIHCFKKFLDDKEPKCVPGEL